MTEVKTIEKRIRQYLEEINSHLSALSDEESSEILSSVHSHIESELQQRSAGRPTLEVLEEILQDMDPPESYAQNIMSLPGSETPATRFSRFAIFGAALLPFGLTLILLVFPISTANARSSTSVWQWIARFTILPLGILAPFASTVLGLMGVSEIRKSGGRIIGMPLAFSVGLFYPIILLDSVLLLFTAMIFSAEDYWNIILAVAILMTLLIDYFLLKSVWKTANRIK